MALFKPTADDHVLTKKDSLIDELTRLFKKHYEQASNINYFSKLPGEVRNKIYAELLPPALDLFGGTTNSNFDNGFHPFWIQMYFSFYGQLFQIDHQTRKETKDYFFSQNKTNLMITLDFDHDDYHQKAIEFIGAERIFGLFVDVHLHPQFPLLPRLKLLSEFATMHKLSIFVFANDNTDFEDPFAVDNASMEQYLTTHGHALLAVLTRLQAVEITVVNKYNVSAIDQALEGYLSQAQWLSSPKPGHRSTVRGEAVYPAVVSKITKEDKSLRVLIRRGLAASRPPIYRLADDTESKVIDETFWDNAKINNVLVSPPPSPRKPLGHRHGLTTRSSVDL